MKALFKLALPLLSAAVLTGCIDDKYDLSDIDTNAEVQVKDLVIPVNIDNITLRNIFDIEENGHIKVVDGKYVFTENGTFKSDEINIPEIFAASPYIAPTEMHLDATEALTAPQKIRKSGSDVLVEYEIRPEAAHFEYEMKDVSEFIVSIDNAKVDFNIDIKLSIEELNEFVSGVDIKGLTIQLPKGLVAESEDGTYDSETGILNIGDTRTTGNELVINVEVDQINFTNSAASYDYATRLFHFEDDLAINSGTILVKQSDIVAGSVADIPSTITFRSEYNLSDIHVVAFTGNIKYTLDGLNIDPIGLTDIPAVLNQEGTNIMLDNPQIYFGLNNPIAAYKLTAQAGMEITALRNNSPAKTFGLDNGYFVIECDKGDVDYNYCMSPYKPIEYYTGYENAEHVPFTSLGDVLSGNGLPQTLEVSFTNPMIPEQKVTNFLLGQDMGEVHGQYTLYAPLSFKGGSDVIYTERVDGWNDEDVDKIIIKTLEVSCIVDSELPLEVDFFCYPIDVNGNQINDVEVDGAIINAQAKDQHFVITITGEVTHLDGVVFTAMAIADDSHKTLAPDMTIVLKDLKAKVSGNYTTEL